MKIFTIFTCLALVLVLTLGSFAGEIPRVTQPNSTLHGGNVSFQKAGLDTINLMAAADDPTNAVNDGCEMPGFSNVEPYYRADFEMGDDQGRVETDGSGWTSYDITQPTLAHWQVSDYDGFNTYPNQRAWCGDINIVSCDPADPAGGYGNSWNDLLVFNKSVGNPAVSTGVNISALLQYDTEPGYDYVYLSAQLQDQDLIDLLIFDGQSQDSFGDPAPVTIAGAQTYLPGDYINDDQVSIYWRFASDGAWADEDCSFYGAGACQVDDIEMALTNDGNTIVYSEDFEDFDFGPDWAIEFPVGVGDFARIYRALEDNDPCNTNYTAQVAFIDDGVAVPGTGGSQCINWCYGPGGYIVTTTGGLAGDTAHIHNAIESPVMEWPLHARNNCDGPVPDGIILTFGAYSHEDLSADAPGIFYTWGVRSAAPGEDITAAPWLDRNFVYYTSLANYVRGGNDVTDLMVESRDRVQVQLTVYELGYQWTWTGNDGYPAPYFDNVTVKIFPYYGPGLAGRQLDLANDNWPARGSIDYGDLPSHSVRFDSANNISLPAHLRNDPGDSMVVDVVPVRAGSELMTNPRLYYHMQRNPIFDAGRTSGLPDIGSILAMPAVANGQVTPDKWAFDLPDTGFFFPGDVLHYFIGATDEVGGVQQSATLPADTTGFSTGFGDPLGYNSTFVVRALPSIVSDGFGGYTHPQLLFLNDSWNASGGENEWYMSLNNIGLLVEQDYDVYLTNGSPSGVGNGIGGRANDLVLTGYSEILYTSGILGVNTIANGDLSGDAGDDVGVLTAWLDQGGKDMFLTGDDLASDLAQSGVATLGFLENYMGLSVVTSDVRIFIDNQATPLVYPVPGNPVFLPGGSLQSWIAYGGCPGVHTFDGVNVTNGGVRIAEFNDPSGIGYNFSAATLKTGAGALGTSRTISMPVDFMFIYADPAAGGHQLPARAQLLRDVLSYFGIEGDPQNISATENIPGLEFATSNFPNPFNPSTTIKYSMPKAGHLTINVYNVRGQLVKTLIDGNRPAGADQTIIWDGTDNQGSAVSSGIYFYEARTGGEVTVQKMALVK